MIPRVCIWLPAPVDEVRKHQGTGHATPSQSAIARHPQSDSRIPSDIVGPCCFILSVREGRAICWPGWTQSRVPEMPDMLPNVLRHRWPTPIEQSMQN